MGQIFWEACLSVCTTKIYRVSIWSPKDKVVKGKASTIYRNEESIGPAILQPRVSFFWSYSFMIIEVRRVINDFILMIFKNLSGCVFFSQLDRINLFSLVLW